MLFFCASHTCVPVLILATYLFVLSGCSYSCHSDSMWNTHLFCAAHGFSYSCNLNLCLFLFSPCICSFCVAALILAIFVLCGCSYSYKLCSKCMAFLFLPSPLCVTHLFCVHSTHMCGFPCSLPHEAHLFCAAPTGVAFLILAIFLLCGTFILCSTCVAFLIAALFFTTCEWRKDSVHGLITWPCRTAPYFWINCKVIEDHHISEDLILCA